MKRVFLDTNILVDYVENRERGDDAKQLLMRGRDGDVELAASFLTFANLAYILGKKRIDVYEALTWLVSIVKVLPMNNAILRKALSHRTTDFEDMQQYQCAMKGNYDVIVTNNKRDFVAFSELPLMTASELLEALDKI